jgi:predicted nuclease of predicted toxin-antitoxin system
MKFLLDQDVYADTARLLAGLGHDAVPVAQRGLSQAEDSELLETACRESRILITRDRDFGSLVFVRDLGTGVIYLRMSPATQNAVHEELARVLTEHSEEDLRQAFVVVEPGRHRFRKTSRSSMGGE